MHYISIVSTIVTFIFVIAVYRRYSERGGTHNLLWTIGLLFYGLGTLTEVVMLFAYNGFALKVWYICGAMLTAAWLGQGTVHLLVRKTTLVKTLTIILGLVTLLSIVLVIAAPETSAAAAFDTQRPVSIQYKDILVRNGMIVTLTILLNIYGTITLVGGAIYSAFLFWRKKVLIHRVYGNILIAAGAMLPAMGGTFIKMGLPDWLYVSELFGAIIMYWGFIEATKQESL